MPSCVHRATRFNIIATRCESVFGKGEGSVILYAPLHEKDLPYQPLRPSVGCLNCLKTHFPTSKPLGRLRTHTLRDVFDGIFYILRSGCPWRLLRHDFPLWPTVYHHFRIFRLRGVWHLVFKVLRTAERQRVARTPTPPRP